MIENNGRKRKSLQHKDLRQRPSFTGYPNEYFISIIDHILKCELLFSIQESDCACLLGVINLENIPRPALIVKHASADTDSRPIHDSLLRGL